MSNYLCMYCGAERSSISSLTGATCNKNPEGNTMYLMKEMKNPNMIANTVEQNVPV